MTYWIIKMHDSALTVEGDDWAWGPDSKAIKFGDAESASRVRVIVEKISPWNGKCALVEKHNAEYVRTRRSDDNG